MGDILMLVTYSWRQFKNVGDRIQILVASFVCWCPTLSLMAEPVTNILKLSPTHLVCNIRNQHRKSEINLRFVKEGFETKNRHQDTCAAKSIKYTMVYTFLI